LGAYLAFDAIRTRASGAVSGRAGPIAKCAIGHRAGKNCCAQFVSRAQDITDAGFKVELRSAAESSFAAPRHEVNMGNFYMDISRIRDELGYEPRYSPERAMADYTEWLRAHEM